MKSILISIQPKWCELIASGKKTIEVRKTCPKTDTPFKCYIYCTKDAIKHYYIDEYGDIQFELIPQKVVGEFVCDKVYDITTPADYFREYLFFAHHGKRTADSQDLDARKLLKETCLLMRDIIDYANGKTLYGWRISDLKIYEKLKELGEFWAYNDEWHKRYENEEDYCCYDSTNEYGELLNECSIFEENVGVNNCYRCWEEWSGWCHRITRPPQSWCYVEEVVIDKV